MKTIIALALILITTKSFSATEYTCVAGRSETINFNLSATDSKVVLSFKDATDADLKTDLKNRKVTLKLDAERSDASNGWAIYTGVILTDKASNEYRHIEVTVAPATASKFGNFAISPRGEGAYPSYLSQYELNCK